MTAGIVIDWRRVILAGCGTWMAAKRLGWPFIAVTWFVGSDSEAAAFSIRDNRTSELSDASALAALSADAELDLLTLGFETTELADLLRQNAPPPALAPVDCQRRLDELQPHCRSCTCRHGAKS